MSTSVGQQHPYPPSYGHNRNYERRPPKGKNVLGIIALAAAVVGFVFACIPGILIVGWVLLPIGFLVGIISLFMSGKAKWPGLVAIIVSIVGTVVGFVVFIGVLGSSLDGAIDENGKATSSDSSGSSASNNSEPKNTNQENPHFGRKYEWEDGIALRVGAPETFTPSETAALGTDGSADPSNARKFTVTIQNGTDKPIDAASVSSTVLSGGKQADLVIDSENNIDGGPQGKIQPGKDLTYDIAYTVDDPNDFSMDFTLYDDSYHSHEVTFVS
ncbi:DUF308 domain-containing protein [Rothia uropygialis]|uniref:DUF308 domain-containing protein n=1 Tax=Kocuria sp. 36 TaxID=1415402 RepID=UPI00101C0DCD|nr:DUF308 domain-containing protein [Kocuria sp. 36]